MHPLLAAESPARIAVFRALVLGDLLCATPALRAVRAAWPAAELTLIGLPWAAELAWRLPQVDRFETFPGCPGLPERRPDPEALPGFLARMRARRFDLVLQLHGSGSIVNPLLARFGAHRVAGFADPDAASPDAWAVDPSLHTPWPRAGHETERLLRLTDHLGLARRGSHLDFPLADADRAALLAACPAWPDLGRYVCVHAGAQLASRRWPVVRFAAVADALAAAGCRIVLTGSRDEAPIAASVRAAMRHEALDWSGRTSLPALGALLERAALLVSNDTGVMHVAAALGTPSVAISSGADVARWAPADAARHAVLWHDTPCRPCAHPVCPYGHECALGVDVDAVRDAALRRLERVDA